MSDSALIPWRDLGRISYQRALAKQAEDRPSSHAQVDSFVPDPVITLGLRAKAETSEIETLRVDRGGLATYHGPGQIVFFPKVHLPTWGLSVKRWVEFLAETTVATLRHWDIPSHYDTATPGVFTPKGKIASVGLKIRAGWSHHGLALNVNGDLRPFSRILACGVQNAAIDQMQTWHAAISASEVSKIWVDQFRRGLTEICL